MVLAGLFYGANEMEKKQAALLDITSFDAVKESEEGYDLELKHADGSTDTGVIVTIIGKHSDVVVAAQRLRLNKLVREEQMAKRRGKDVEIDVDKLADQARDDAILRVTGWKNLKQEFSKELLKAALVRNPHWIDQIVSASDDAGNFIKTA
jgi:hypothetical protein